MFSKKYVSVLRLSVIILSCAITLGVSSQEPLAPMQEEHLFKIQPLMEVPILDLICQQHAINPEGASLCHQASALLSAARVMADNYQSPYKKYLNNGQLYYAVALPMVLSGHKLFTNFEFVQFNALLIAAITVESLEISTDTAMRIMHVSPLETELESHWLNGDMHTMIGIGLIAGVVLAARSLKRSVLTKHIRLYSQFIFFTLAMIISSNSRDMFAFPSFAAYDADNESLDISEWVAGAGNFIMAATIAGIYAMEREWGIYNFFMPFGSFTFLAVLLGTGVGVIGYSVHNIGISTGITLALGTGAGAVVYGVTQELTSLPFSQLNNIAISNLLYISLSVGFSQSIALASRVISDFNHGDTFADSLAENTAEAVYQIYDNFKYIVLVTVGAWIILTAK